MTVAALILAAGRGERFGGTVPKAYVRLGGRTVVERSIAALAACPAVTRVVPVVAESERERFLSLVSSGFPGAEKVAEPVPGGVLRQDSVRAGIEALPGGVEWVAVHDAARCLVTSSEVESVIEAARETGAAILARPSGDTVKRVVEGVIVETPAREECWAAQTPQVFRIDLLREALAKAETEEFTATDDAQLVERLGVGVRVVEGLPSNLKVTLAGDVALAEAWLSVQGRLE